jgi:hypothetical protein
MAHGEETGARLVWARKGASLTTCPRSYITAESLGLIEEFLVRRRLGGTGFGELSARQVEAFSILENELEAERRDGQNHAREVVR